MPLPERVHPLEIAMTPNLNKANLAKITTAMKREMAKEDQSMCAAIRNVAKRLASVRRAEIMHVLTAAPFKFNAGTVRRQIQEGRAK